LGGLSTFRNNSAATGGAVELGSKGRMTFTTSKRSSCWVANYAVKSDAGAALRVEGNGRVDFGALAQHNFGSNVAGISKMQNDITVLESGAYVCGVNKPGAGRYKIEGNVCSFNCAVQQICKCLDSQMFADRMCRCKARV
jgi:hypothetical protein